MPTEPVDPIVLVCPHCGTPNIKQVPNTWMLECQIKQCGETFPLALSTFKLLSETKYSTFAECSHERRD